MAGAGCKPTGNSQQTHTGTVEPQRDAVVAPRAPAVKAASTPTNEKTSDKTRKCEEICRIAVPLHCTHQDECVQGCESMASAPMCKAELNRMYDCLLRQPVESWECDENGVGAIRDPFCGKEQAAVVNCVGGNLDRM